LVAFDSIGLFRLVPDREADLILLNRTGYRSISSQFGIPESEPVRMNPGSAARGSGNMNLVSITDAVNPSDESFRDVSRSGVTSVLEARQTDGLLGGIAADLVI
jgi:hypothetical protein